MKAINYVLKPISEEKFFLTFDEILGQIKEEENDAAVMVKCNEGVHKILISNLVFAEVIGRNVLYHLLSGKIIEYKEPFSSVCKNLPKYGCFIKTPCSFIVNMQYVDNIENHRVTLHTISSVPIAQGKLWRSSDSI